MHVRLLIALLALLTAAPAAAQGNDQKVALAPIATLGSEGTSNESKLLAEALANGIEAVPGYSVVPQKELLAAVKKAKRPELRTCDGDDECLAQLGELLGTPLVIYAELGGLGDAQVVALKLIETASKREVRSTTAEFAETERDAATRGAAYRLLAPGLFVGKLLLKVDIEGATIYLDGARIGKSPQPPIQAEVGAHALRVTHPEYRDFVRFVDLEFDKQQELEVPMKAFPIIDKEMREHARKGAPVDTGPTRVGATPWYKKWYTVAGAGVIVFVGSALVVGMLTDGIDADREEVVGE